MNNKKITRKFIEKIIEKAEKDLSFKIYYEEAPNDAKFPYGVIPTLTISPLDYGFNCVFDIEIYVNESANINVEDLCDELRINYDNYSICEDDIGFHIGYDNHILTKQSEQDLVYRRVSFIARIF